MKSAIHNTPKTSTNTPKMIALLQALDNVKKLAQECQQIPQKERANWTVEDLAGVAWAAEQHASMLVTRAPTCEVEYTYFASHGCAISEMSLTKLKGEPISEDLHGRFMAVVNSIQREDERRARTRNGETVN